MRKKTSIIWTIEKERLQEILDTSSSHREVLRKLGFQITSGNNSYTLKERIVTHNLSEEKLISNRQTNPIVPNQLPHEEIFRKDSQTGRGCVKRLILKLKLLKYKCEECGNEGCYNGKNLTLQLDHINGINNDNRIENLRFLCPNCHSQTSNFAGRSCKKEKIDKFCLCGSKIHRTSGKCHSCSNKRVSWPPRETLEKLVWTKPMRELAKDLNASDVALIKHCKLMNISRPPQGYWLKNGSQPQN